MNLVNKGSPKRKTSVHVLNRKWGTKQGEKEDNINYLQKIIHEITPIPINRDKKP